MANFEDYLNDYSLNDEPEEQLDPPVVSGGYGDELPELDAYVYSGNGFQGAYGSRSDYAGYNATSYEVPAYDEQSYSDKGESYDQDYQEDQPERKGFLSGIKLPEFGSAKGKASSSANGGTSNMLLTLLVAASLLLSLISVISLSSIKSSVKETKDTLSSQIASLTAATSQLSDRVTALESGVSTAQQQTSTEGTSKYITISKQPTSANAYVGRGEDGLAMFFSIAAKGNGIGYDSFKWEKQDASGSWVSVGFDGPYSKNEAFGLQNEIGKYDSGEYAGCYYSIIYSYGLTSAGFGKYRCVVTDSTGERAYSDMVEIRNNG